MSVSGLTDDAKKKSSLEVVEYKEALNLITECARLLHVRWLQAELIKELIDVIYKFKQRHWTMIIKEHKNGKQVGLWINTARCLEIWIILETTKKKKYNDLNILRKLLRIVQFYQKRVKAKKPITSNMTAVEKNTIEADVGLLMREHKIASMLTREAEIFNKAYVKPELALKSARHKFKICFECSLRLKESAVTCEFCGLVSFCDKMCMITNMDMSCSHPCNERLKQKYTTSAVELGHNDT